jgi:hypothetical protein
MFYRRTKTSPIYSTVPDRTSRRISQMARVETHARVKPIKNWYRVVKLQRTRIGPIELGDFPEGCWRPLTQSELYVVIG